MADSLEDREDGADGTRGKREMSTGCRGWATIEKPSYCRSPEERGREQFGDMDSFRRDGHIYKILMHAC